MTTIQKLESDIESIKDAVGHVLYKHQAAYVNREALRALLVEAENQILIELVEHPAPLPLHIPNNMSHPFGLLHSKAFMGYVSNKLILDLFESTDEWKEAYGILQPLVDQLAEVEQKLADEIAEKGRKQVALNTALREAEQAALQAAQQDPAVIAARAALDAPAPAPKAKGKLGTIGEAVEAS